MAVTGVHGGGARLVYEKAVELGIGRVLDL